MKKNIVILLLVSFVSFCAYNMCESKSSFSDVLLTISNIEALATGEIDVNIDFSFKEANYFYCRCRDLDGGSARCTGANALSLRRNCYKGSTTVLCKNWQSNCE